MYVFFLTDVCCNKSRNIMYSHSTIVEPPRPEQDNRDNIPASQENTITNNDKQTEQRECIELGTLT